MMDKSNNDRSIEIRIALVLYGGVSLAVYENGVTRSFHDLVADKGVFRLLKKMLDADAVVDVIAGASAGGINGLLLAAALESGSEFKGSADLWRNKGDLNALMRPLSEAEEAESLLSGDVYQKELIQAFKGLVKPSPASKIEPGDMDVFITGTDLYGRVVTLWDSLGNPIEDKCHRVVFHLKHRSRDRAFLGMPPDFKRDNDPDEQAHVLASIARITSTFPVAFPPFRIDQVPGKYKEAVARALKELGRVDSIPADGNDGEHAVREADGGRVYVDGGVLNNKPFGPVLKAIFYRTAHRVVYRRLFYVEPDPEQFTSIADDKEIPNPVGVAVASLTSIPSHQSISEELNSLREHNARIRWFRLMKEDFLTTQFKAGGPSASEPSSIYTRVRFDSLIKSMLLDIEDVPSAMDYVTQPGRKVLYKEMLKWADKISVDDIAPYDINYHMRRAFHVFYRIYDRLAAAGTDAGEYDGKVLAVQSRILKLLKTVRELLYLLRDFVIRDRANEVEEKIRQEQEVLPDKIVDEIFNVFRCFLDSRFELWKEVALRIEDARSDSSILQIGEREQKPLSDDFLKELGEHGKDKPELLAKAAGKNSIEPEKSILQVIEDFQTKLLNFYAREEHFTDKQQAAVFRALLDEFDRLDSAFFPLEFASGIHEIDEIKFLRVSPLDAQKGLSNLAAYKKVSGDELAHFSAFFRKDWRSNDILWGRLDSICQIVDSLLDYRAMRRIFGRSGNLEGDFTVEGLRDVFPKCPLIHIEELKEAWAAFVKANEQALSDHKLQVRYKHLKVALITAAQHEAAHEDLEGVLDDHFDQCREWDIPPNHDKKVLDTADKDRGDYFRSLEIGDQTVGGEKGAVPVNILWEYASKAYLMLWGMMRRSLGAPKRTVKFLDSGLCRGLFRSPILFSYLLAFMMRKEKKLYPLAIVAVATALITWMVFAIAFNHWSGVAAFVILLAFILFINFITPRCCRKLSPPSSKPEGK